MAIVFRDNLGYISVNVNDDGIQFSGDLVYFTDTAGKDYTVEICYIVAVCKDGLC